MGTAVLPEINPALHGAPLGELFVEPRGRQTDERRQDARRPGELAPHLRKSAWLRRDSARLRPDDAQGSGGAVDDVDVAVRPPPETERNLEGSGRPRPVADAGPAVTGPRLHHRAPGGAARHDPAQPVAAG